MVVQRLHEKVLKKSVDRRGLRVPPRADAADGPGLRKCVYG